MRYLLDVVATTHGVEHHVALPDRAGVAGRSGALADETAAGRLVALGATVHVVDMRRNPLHPANTRAVFRLNRIARDIHPDLVHGHSSVGGAVARVAARTSGLPCAYTPNGLMTSVPALLFERALGPLTSRFVAVSASEGDVVVARRLVPTTRVTVIPNGIRLDPSLTTGGAARTSLRGGTPDTNDDGGGAEVSGDSAGRLRCRLGLAEGTPLVATIVRLAPQKAPEEFVRACVEVSRRRPGVHFLLIGLGPLQVRVDQEVARGGLEGRFHQIAHFPDAAAAMGELDVVVLLSRYEGGPYVPLEAMRAGVPVVLSDVVGNRDTVESGVEGFLVPFGDAPAAASAVVRLLDDHELRQRVVAAATARLRRDFDVALMGQRLAALYSQLAVERRPAQPARRRRNTRKLPTASSGQSS